MKTLLRSLTFFLILALAPFGSGLHAAEKPGRLACVGDSITFGVGTGLPAFYSYPAQLERMLGKAWEVRGFGDSGSTLLKGGDKPYQNQQAFKNALNFNPEVVVIMLGTNDTKPQNWRLKDSFVADYRDLIGKFKALPSRPRIYICRPVPVPGIGNYGINNAAILEQFPLVELVAKEEAVGVIDLYASLDGHDDLLPDRVHPNSGGAERMARAVYRVLTGGDFEGPVPATRISSWQGFEQLEFVVAGRSCRLVRPVKPAKGNPWIWRAEFFGHEPQTDIALLKLGFHVGYIQVSDMFGSPASLDLMDAYYDHVVKTYQLASKTTLLGFSRGGLYAVNWAARNPGRVASLYLDAPVLDVKSWPAGKGLGKGAPEEWTKLKKVFGLSEEQALAAAISPLDHIKPLADAKIPILSICGDADTAVPYLENTAIFAERYRALGGPIEVVLKPGVDHHPHSLKDPEVIVKFILRSVGRPPENSDESSAAPRHSSWKIRRARHG